MELLGQPAKLKTDRSRVLFFDLIEMSDRLAVDVFKDNVNVITLYRRAMPMRSLGRWSR